MTVVTVHDFVYERYMNGPKKWVHVIQKNAAIRAAQAIICVSESTKQDLLHFVGINPDQSIHVIYNGVSDIFQPLDIVLSNSPFILFVGQRGGYKNFNRLLDAMPYLPDYELHCVGGGAFRSDELKGISETVVRRVRHLGFVTDEVLNVLYNRAVCLAYPSSYEGFGIPVIEAMKAGCPVVSVDCKAVLEVGRDALSVVCDDAPRGMLSTLYLVAIWWYIYIKTFGRYRFQSAVIISIILLTGLNLLALGSRLAVVSGIISLLVYYILFVRNVKPRHAKPRKLLIVVKFFTIIIFLALLMSLIGVMRSGEAISVEGLLSIFAAEPVFIYASVLSYYSMDSIHLFAIPWDLLTGIVGSIPSFLFPNKVDLFLAFSPRSDDAYSGFGGVHHLVSLLSNFGLLGFPIVSLFEGFCLGLLIRRVNVSSFYRAASLSSIGVLTFILYREGLQAPVKLFLFNFTLMPYLIFNFLFFIKFSITAHRHLTRG